MKIALFDGKRLLTDGEIATTDCCCGCFYELATTYGVVVDSTGDVIMAHSRQGSGGGVTVTKINSDCEFQWDYLPASLGPIPRSLGIAVDASDNIYVATWVTSATESVTKLNSSGVLQWRDNDINGGAECIVVDSTYVYAAGNKQGSPNRGEIAKYTLAGVLQWNIETHTPGLHYCIGVDSNGNVYAGAGTVFKKYDSSGVEQAVVTTESYNAVVIDSNDNIYVCGVRTSSKSVWKLDTSLVVQASYDTGNTAHGICLDSNENVIVSGVRSSSLNVWKLNSSLVLLDTFDTGGHTMLDCDVDGDDILYVVGVGWTTFGNEHSFQKTKAWGTM